MICCDCWFTSVASVCKKSQEMHTYTCSVFPDATELRSRAELALPDPFHSHCTKPPTQIKLLNLGLQQDLEDDESKR